MDYGVTDPLENTSPDHGTKIGHDVCRDCHRVGLAAAAGNIHSIAY